MTEKDGRRVIRIRNKEGESGVNGEMKTEMQNIREQESREDKNLKEVIRESYLMESEEETITMTEEDSIGTVEWLEEGPLQQVK